MVTLHDTESTSQEDTQTLSNSKFYQDGRKTGLEWDANWYPGGPWIYPKPSGFYYPDSKEMRHHLESKKENDEWIKGFEDGLKIRLETSPAFQKFWNDHSGTQRYRRFKEFEV
jgi:hypothetical protein